MKNPFHLILLCAFLVLGIYAAANAASDSVLNSLNANNDHGFWLEESVLINRGDWRIEYVSQQRWGSDYRTFWYQKYALVCQYDVRQFFGLNKAFQTISIGPGYTYSEEIQKNTAGHFHWAPINRSILEANIEVKVCGWKVNQRIRGEYYSYCIKHYKDYGLYRHRLDISPSWKIWKLTPYVSNEWFFRNNTYSETSPTGLVGGYYQNRFRIGLAFDGWREAFSSALFWQWKRDKQNPSTTPRWFNTYHFGLIFLIRI